MGQWMGRATSCGKFLLPAGTLPAANASFLGLLLVFPNRTIGIHFHSPAAIVDGRICTEGPFARFVDSLAPFFGRLLVFLYDGSARADSLCKLEADNCEWINLGTKPHVTKTLFSGKGIFHKWREAFAQCDAFVVRGPTLTDVQFITMALPAPVGVYLVNDWFAENLLALRYDRRFRQFVLTLLRWWTTKRLATCLHRCAGTVISGWLREVWCKRGLKLPLVPSATLYENEGCVCENRFSREPFRILYAGRLEEQRSGKSVVTLIEALDILTSCSKNRWRLDLVGPCRDGRARRVLRGWVQDRPGRVVWHGERTIGEDVWRYFRAADVFVLPSDVETMGRAVIEAMAFSVPVVATNVGGIPDNVKHRCTGLLVSPHRPDQVADALQELADNPGLRVRLIRNGLEHARTCRVETRAAELVSVLARAWGWG